MVNNDAALVMSVLVLNVVPKCTSAEPQIDVNRVQFRLQSALLLLWRHQCSVCGLMYLLVSVRFLIEAVCWVKES